MACVRKCRHSRLASRVHQNSPRTRLLASKPRRSCTRGAVGSFQSSRQRSHPRLAKRLCVPPAQGLGAFPCVCHRPQGRLGFSGGVLPSSGRSPRPAPPVLVQFCCPCLWSSPSPCCPGLCPDSPVALPCSLSLSVCLRLRQSPLFLSGWPLSSSPPPPFPVP